MFFLFPVMFFEYKMSIKSINSVFNDKHFSFHFWKNCDYLTPEVSESSSDVLFVDPGDPTLNDLVLAAFCLSLAHIQPFCDFQPAGSGIEPRISRHEDLAVTPCWVLCFITVRSNRNIISMCWTSSGEEDSWAGPDRWFSER